VKQGDVESLIIPTTYTLDNRLLYVAIRQFLVDSLEILEEGKLEEIKKLTNELRLFLISKFKFAFTKIELNCINKVVKGHIEYTNGNPLTFELLTSNN
jgi:hypothetical protein